MSDLSRRGFIGSAAVTASVIGARAESEEDFSFKNNVPDPLLAGEVLPTFKFELEKSLIVTHFGEGSGTRRVTPRPTSSVATRGGTASR